MSLDLNGKRLLLIKPSSLGDICHAVAGAWALKARWPSMHLTWLVNSSFEPLLRGMSCVDATLPFDRARFKGLLGAFRERTALRAFVTTLRAGRFDVALDMQGLFRSGTFARLSGAPVRIGFRSAREGARLFYTQRVNTPAQPVHARDRYDALTAALGCVKPAREDLDVSQAERQSARELLARDGYEGEKLVAVCPGARWESKRYAPERFAQVLDDLALQGAIRPVIVGSPDMAAPCAATVQACTKARPINLCGQTGLRELAALLDLSDLLVTCDSGPMHIAAAQGTPVVAVLGPTDPRRTGPYGQLENVISGQCELMPCLKRACPGLGDKCMKDLPAARVAEKARALLSAGK
ncbi:MAG: lipopolysaccharide heptosyltransferase II [Planctomycetes bacterium]|nr:lipopolysaccharide heptosyltransferase II [Planctomycetota bacterium]